MDTIKHLIDLFLHLDKHLYTIILEYGVTTNIFLFLIIFAETGLVFTPFLPGDSLLFAAGTFAAKGSFNIHILFLILSLAAILGDTVNYWAGHYIGPRIFEKEKIRFFKKSILKKHISFMKSTAERQ